MISVLQIEGNNILKKQGKFFTLIGEYPLIKKSIITNIRKSLIYR